MKNVVYCISAFLITGGILWGLMIYNNDGVFLTRICF